MVVGIIGDTHFPFVHKDYLAFIKKTFKKYKVNCVVHIGDVVDNHAISYHESDPDGRSSGDEGVAADKVLQEWYRAFPKMHVLLGNHDRLPERKAKTFGLSGRLIKAFAEVWKTPKGWKVYPGEVEIDGVLYTHGTGNSGKNAALNLAMLKMQSLVMGHTHSFGGVQFVKGKENVFGMNVGCGIDDTAYAFEYGKHFRYRPTLGCGIVIDGKQPIYIPMES